MAWLVLTMPVIIAFLGLVLDLGVYMLRSQMLDAATDAAALAATNAWDREYWKWHGQVRIDQERATVLAREYLHKNQPQARLIEVKVGPANRVHVRTEYRVPFFFVRIFGWEGESAVAYSTAVRRSVK